jgi:hypothetical protein
MTNREFIRKYIRGEQRFGANGHLGFADNRLINYSTEICVIDRENKVAAVNNRKYSSTTSRIQSELRYQLSVAGYEITEYDGEPASFWNYGYMGARNVTKEEMYGKS